MMNKLNLFETQWCDIVFENRNQAYGAYQLRKEDSSRTVFAMFATTGGLAILLVISYLSQNIAFASSIKIEEGLIMHEMVLPPAEDKPIEQPVIEKVQHQTLKEMVKNVVFKLDKDSKATEEVKTIDELKNKNTGAYEVKGPVEEGKLLDPPSDGPTDNNLTEDTESSPAIIVQKMPSFIGGDDALFEYLSKNTKYPTMSKENNISGTVFLKFVVGKNGEIRDIEVLKGVRGGKDLEQEAIRVIEQMPKWIPGVQNGKKVSVYFTLPIKFSLKS